MYKLRIVQLSAGALAVLIFAVGVANITMPTKQEQTVAQIQAEADQLKHDIDTKSISPQDANQKATALLDRYGEATGDGQTQKITQLKYDELQYRDYKRLCQETNQDVYCADLPNMRENIRAEVAEINKILPADEQYVFNE